MTSIQFVIENLKGFFFGSGHWYNFENLNWKCLYMTLILNNFLVKQSTLLGM